MRYLDGAVRDMPAPDLVAIANLKPGDTVRLYLIYCARSHKYWGPENFDFYQLLGFRLSIMGRVLAIVIIGTCEDTLTARRQIKIALFDKILIETPLGLLSILYLPW